MRVWFLGDDCFFEWDRRLWVGRFLEGDCFFVGQVASELVGATEFVMGMGCWGCCLIAQAAYECAGSKRWPMTSAIRIRDCFIKNLRVMATCRLRIACCVGGGTRVSF